MRSTVASTCASTSSSTVAARASTGKQQAVVIAKPTSIVSEKRSTSSPLPVAARVFSAVAAAMIAVTGPAFADLNAFEAAAGGGKQEGELREKLSCGNLC